MTLVITNTDFLNGDVYPDQTTDNPIVFYNSVYSVSDISASPENEPNNPAINMWNPDTSSTWKGDGDPTPPGSKGETITIHNVNEVAINYIAIGSHNLYDIADTIIITAQSSTDNVIYSQIETGSLLTSVDDSSPIIFYFNDTTDEYLRISIQMTSAGAIAAPIVGHVKAGTALVLQRREFTNVASGSLFRSIRRTQNMSDSGQYLGQVVLSSKRTMSINQENNTPTFVRDNILDFIAHTEGDPVTVGGSPSTFFYAWRPTTYPDDVLYAWTSDQINPTHQGGDSYGGRMQWSLGMEALT